MNVLVQSHYCVSQIESVADLRAMFPDGQANDLNFVLFSTSGVHGTYLTIEEVEDGMGGDEPSEITVLVIQPRLVKMLYGHIPVTSEDLPFLKKLRETSRAAIQQL